MKQLFSFMLLASVLLSCEQTAKPEIETTEIVTILSEADSIIALAYDAHGVSAFDHKMFEFTFRAKRYSFNFRNEGFKFNRIDTILGKIVHDNYTESNFWREEEGENITVNIEDVEKYKASINSVIYFASLPYKLKDESVLAKYKGIQSIEGKDYLAVEIRFTEEGGGEDHDDIFYYWFDRDSHLLDYFAYSYHTNGGGVRFRSAYNRSKVQGVVFQDYVNYEVTVGTSLIDIPALYETDSLKELSRIENIDIAVTP